MQQKGVSIMAIYSEIRHYVRTSACTIWREDSEIRTPKHEVSQEAYNLFVNEIFKDVKPLTNRDGSISYCVLNNYNEMTETTFSIT